MGCDPATLGRDLYHILRNHSVQNLYFQVLLRDLLEHIEENSLDIDPEEVIEELATLIRDLRWILAMYGIQNRDIWDIRMISNRSFVVEHYQG